MRRVMLSFAILSASSDAGVAQQPSSTPAFEAASVKRSITSSSGWSVSYTPDSLHATNATLSALIQSAHGVRPDRLVGGPSWVRTTRFDVNAKAAQALPREQLRRMAQRLLEDRFGLVLTKEQREQEAYVMRLARADGRLGPDVRRAADDCLDAAAPGGVPTIRAAGPPLQSSTGARPTFSGRCATIASVAGGLSRNLGIEVVDQTGLQGRWDYVIAYAALTVDVPAALEPGQASLPSVFVAVEEQLGLKLERNPHGSVEYVIIAKAHAPTED
ncbi:MAG TPA: TIGR03435 family protein [Vicinamibacterales bacterium]|nr:TIGR03435 family protein [Vicinamibacterales bacterium]